MPAVEGVFKTDTIKALGLGDVVAIDQRSTVGTALETVQREGKGYVLLLDDDGKLAGLMTERDVLMKIVARDIRYDDSIAGYMTSAPRALTERETIATAIRLMDETGYQHIPIIDDSGAPVSVLRTIDIVKFLAEAFPAQVLNMPPEPHQTIQEEEGG